MILFDYDTESDRVLFWRRRLSDLMKKSLNLDDGQTSSYVHILETTS